MILMKFYYNTSVKCHCDNFFIIHFNFCITIILCTFLFLSEFSRQDLDENFRDYLERAKTWHQMTVVAQVCIDKLENSDNTEELDTMTYLLYLNTPFLVYLRHGETKIY